MTLIYIIRETSLMMGFTFLVGIAFAYALKLMTLLFTCFNGERLRTSSRRIRIWGRAYRISVIRTYEHIRSITWSEGLFKEMPVDAEEKAQIIYAMNALAEYHFGNPEETDDRQQVRN